MNETITIGKINANWTWHSRLLRVCADRFPSSPLPIAASESARENRYFRVIFDPVIFVKVKIGKRKSPVLSVQRLHFFSLIDE